MATGQVDAQQFYSWLNNNQVDLAQFLEVLQKFIKFLEDQGKYVPPKSGGTLQVPNWKPGEEVELTSQVITREQLDALYSGNAEAHVKETAIKIVEWVLTALMFVG